uniref:hypothetical protein n=1 Tax=Thaumasiovibrio occultus TaxID=1891184 RepID=UPI00131CD090|nr:hypothetical protein [Thaumasiovibrio occultus]
MFSGSSSALEMPNEVVCHPITEYGDGSATKDHGGQHQKQIFYANKLSNHSHQ